MTTAPYQTVAPTSQPINRTEVKQFSNIDHSQDDTLIDGLIAACTSYFDGRDGILGRALITQTWARRLSSFSDRMRLPLGPVASVSVTYYDTDDVLQTLTPTIYQLARDDIGTYIERAWQQSWPNYTPRPDGIVLTWVAGTSATLVPRAIRQAMLMTIAHWYENRETVVIGVTGMEIPFAASALLAPYRRRESYDLEEEVRYYPWP